MDIRSRMGMILWGKVDPILYVKGLKQPKLDCLGSKASFNGNDDENQLEISTSFA